MAWIEILGKLEVDQDTTEAKIEICWGAKKGAFNFNQAVVNLEKFKEALKFDSLSLLGEAFNVRLFALRFFEISLEDQLAALIRVLKNFKLLREADWR